MRQRRLDGVLPTALEGLQQRRKTTKKLLEIDKLLQDESAVFTTPSTAVKMTSRGCSFGSRRNSTKNSRYWLVKSASVPGPGAYVTLKADGLIKPNIGRGGVLGLRIGGCCRFQPCQCKTPNCEQVDNLVTESDDKCQDTKQPRRSSPSLVAYSKPSSTKPDFETREQQRRVAAVQEAKQRWKRLGLNTKPNYRWTERRVGAGGALPMTKSTSRDGAGNSAAKARLRKLLISDRKKQICQAEASRAVRATAEVLTKSKVTFSAAVDMAKLTGRNCVRSKRKNQRVVTAFDR